MGFKFVSSILFGILISVTASSAQIKNWDLNDVTYILPLPNPGILSASIKATDLTSGQEPILKRSLFGGAGGEPGRPLIMSDNVPFRAAWPAYDNLFAVSVRIDPCFQDKFEDSCRPQIRVVWQPIDQWHEGNAISIDAAVHTFYDLSNEDFEKIIQQLQQIKVQYGISTDNLPLGIHPGFSNVTPTAFQTDFHDLILNYLSPNRLSRLAVMKLDFLNIWDFSSENIKDGVFSDLEIFPAHQTVQFSQNSFGFEALRGSPIFDQALRDRLIAEFQTGSIHRLENQGFLSGGVPFFESLRDDQLLDLFHDSENALSSQPADILRRAVRAENPHANLPGTIDCVSCHISNAAKVLSQNQLNTPAEIPNFRFSYQLKNQSSNYGDTHTLRMLGYFNQSIHLQDRVIYESATVADFLNTHRP